MCVKQVADSASSVTVDINQATGRCLLEDRTLPNKQK
jgi:hypothetical protein